jgi:DNA-binding IclR family transcriptional regulator
MAKASRGVQSIEISGRILSVMADAARPLMLRDIANAAGVPPGRAHPYLVSLRKLGLVEQDAHAGLYELGPTALDLALAHIDSREPVRTVWRALPNIAAEIGFGVTMSIWCNLGPIILRTAEVPDQPFTNLRAGSLYSVTTTATGRLFAAFRPDAEVKAVIERQKIQIPPNGLEPEMKANAYKKMLDDVRSQRTSVTTGHPAPGISAVSVPIFDQDKMVAAITAIGPTHILDVSVGSSDRARFSAIATSYSESGVASAG